MKTNLALCVLSICAFGATTAPAFAQAQASADASAWKDFSFSANVGLVTQYRYRGLMQTNNRPAIQGGFDISHDSGFYIGNWDSNISWLGDTSPDISAPIEMDFYGGYKGKIGSGFTYDLGAITYYYPGDYPDGYTSPNTTELYAGIGYGPLSFKYSHAVTNLFGFAHSRNSQYYDLTGNFPTPLWGLIINAHVGYQRLRNTDDGSYTDWTIGLKRNWDNGIAATLSYIDTNANETVYTNSHGRYMGRQTVVLQVSKSF